MTDAPPRALILDFGGVISRTLFETHAETERALGLAPGALTWRGPFDAAGDPLWRSMQRGEITERGYWLARARETGALTGRNWTRMEEFVVAARGADPGSIIRPEARHAIAAAKSAGVKLAILSNELDLFYGADFRGRLPMLQDFAVVVDATHTGILKPDRRAYQSVCDALALAPGLCVFVDDQLKNVEGAAAAGMTAVHFDVRAPAASYREALGHFGLARNEEPSHASP